MKHHPSCECEPCANDPSQVERRRDWESDLDCDGNPAPVGPARSLVVIQPCCGGRWILGHANHPLPVRDAHGEPFTFYTSGEALAAAEALNERIER
jgi:hypothetical protein